MPPRVSVMNGGTGEKLPKPAPGDIVHYRPGDIVNLGHVIHISDATTGAIVTVKREHLSTMIRALQQMAEEESGHVNPTE